MAMNIYQQPPSASRGRHNFVWDRRFCVRQRAKYNTEDIKVLENPATTQALIDAFCDPEDRPEILDPPCYNYMALKSFLRQADLQELVSGRAHLALLDDRRDHSGGDDYSMRNWESERYTKQQLPGHDVKRLTLDEGGLFTKLKENVQRR